MMIKKVLLEYINKLRKKLKEEEDSHKRRRLWKALKRAEVLIQKQNKKPLFHAEKGVKNAEFEIIKEKEVGGMLNGEKADS